MLPSCTACITQAKRDTWALCQAARSARGAHLLNESTARRVTSTAQHLGSASLVQPSWQALQIR